MTDKQITIKMPKRTLAKWLKALRSGEYAQNTDGALFNKKDISYCCLGVLQHVLDGGVEHVVRHGTVTNDPAGLPSTQWLADANITFLHGPNSLITTNNPFLPTMGQYAASVNDVGMPFSKIADAIEACAEGF